jgi:hypothetical protein
MNRNSVREIDGSGACATAEAVAGLGSRPVCGALQGLPAGTCSSGVAAINAYKASLGRI